MQHLFSHRSEMASLLLYFDSFCICKWYFQNCNVSLGWCGSVDIEHRPANSKVAGSIPSQGMCLGCSLGWQLGVCKRQLISMVFCLSFSLPSLLSKNKYIKSFFKKKLLKKNYHEKTFIHSLTNFTEDGVYAIHTFW